MKTILIYSGGLDSTVLLFDLIERGYTVKALSFNYSQRHLKELKTATYFAKKLNIEHKIIDLSSLISCFGNSALVDKKQILPDQKYATDNLKTTVVPNRNMIFISIAAAWAISEKYNTVSYAAHNNDTALYPDCRETFASSLNKTLQLADWHPVSLLRPYIDLSKSDIVKKAHTLKNIPPLQKTWSCYAGQDIHCGTCSTCIDRKEAFKKANIEDLTSYVV